ncbi:MAG TPA: hypothetical protein VKW70_08635 [Terriglobia bacterium]|nr:hypothetical protein [Terriglobia bacterium]
MDPLNGEARAFYSSLRAPAREERIAGPGAEPNLCQGRKLWTRAGQEAFAALPMREAAGQRRPDLLTRLDQLNGWIRELDDRLGQEAERRPEARRLGLSLRRGESAHRGSPEIGDPSLYPAA